MASNDHNAGDQQRFSLDEIIEGTKLGRPWFAYELAQHIPSLYPLHGEAINRAILGSFYVPSIPDGFQATLNDASVTVGSLTCLTQISDWYSANHKSASALIVSSAAQILSATSDAYLFWSLRLLGVPATPDSPTDIPEWTRKDGMRLYSLVVTFYRSLLCTPTPIFRQMLTKDAMLDVLITLWITLIDGEVPLYSCNENGGDPAANREEWVIWMVHHALKVNGLALAQAVLAARICDPETFVERTIQRMVTLPKLRTLNHLPSITSTTLENANVGYIVSITETLVALDEHLRTLFTVAGAPQLYVQVVETTLTTFRTHIGRELLQFSDFMNNPNNSAGRMARALAQMAPYAGALVYWAASARFSTIAIMKAVIDNGAAKLLLNCLSILFDLPFVNRFPVDAIWDMIEEYALHLRVIPILCQHIRTSRFPFSKSSDQKSSLASNGRDADVKAVAKRILALGAFTKQSVRLCDNSKHQNTGKTAKDSTKAQDLKPGAIAQSLGRRSVVTVDILRPHNTVVRSVDDYVSETRPLIPTHLLCRFEALISTFESTNGTSDGSDKSFVRSQSARLVTCGFRLGDKEMRMLLLLKKVGAYYFKGSPSERKRQMAEFRSRGPTARSNFAIEGSMVYTAPAKALPNYAYDSIAGRLLDPYYDDKPEEVRKEMPGFLMQMGELGRNTTPGGIAPIAGAGARQLGTPS